MFLAPKPAEASMSRTRSTPASDGTAVAQFIASGMNEDVVVEVVVDVDGTVVVLLPSPGIRHAPLLYTYIPRHSA